VHKKIRFAPSPTGFLHEGHLFSALYVWAAARKWDLDVHLRIEDHDQSRARPAYIQGIREDLAWFGFEYTSESIQSERNEIYQQALDVLQKNGLVYPCFCSRKQLEAENPKSETGEIIYQGKCLGLAESGKRRVERGVEIDDSMFCVDLSRPHNLRFKTTDKVIDWVDFRLGEFHENPKHQCGDFPIKDRDNQWTYQFAVCVDDLEEGITHIVRGEDIRNSTARQIALSETLSQVHAVSKTYMRPLYLHHPLIVDPNGKKLSKRELAHSLKQDREDGLTAENLLGRVCFKAGLQPTPDSISLKGALQLVESSL